MRMDKRMLRALTASGRFYDILPLMDDSSSRLVNRQDGHDVLPVEEHYGNRVVPAILQPIKRWKQLTQELYR